MEREHYLTEWRKLDPIVLTMTKKDGRCNHDLGQRFAAGKKSGLLLRELSGNGQKDQVYRQKTY